MVSEERATRPLPTPPNRSERGGSVAVGLIPAPEMPEKIAGKIGPDLPELLGRHVDDRVSWDVSIVCDPLTGTDLEAPELLDACRERLRREGWDLAVCLTDLPIYRAGHLVVADASATRKVAGLSLPALGAARLRTLTLGATIQLVDELYARIPELGPDTGETRSSGQEPGWLVAPFRKVEPPDEDMREMSVDARFAAPGTLGHLRLLSGMVLANRPWKLLPGFRGAIAAAFATGAYALVIPSIWTLSDSVGWARLLLLMVAAITALALWIIVAHQLWERPSSREARHWTTLYNGVTVLTISTAVLAAYAVLFALIFLAAWVFVPGNYFQTTLKHPVGFGDYLTLAWLGTSLATVAGALGSGLEDEDRAREAAYGYRQRRRQENEDESDSERSETS